MNKIIVLVIVSSKFIPALEFISSLLSSDVPVSISALCISLFLNMNYGMICGSGAMFFIMLSYAIKTGILLGDTKQSLFSLFRVHYSIFPEFLALFNLKFLGNVLICVNNPQTSLDKTSKACQRRIRYILKRPETVANVTMYKGEALQDKVGILTTKSSNLYYAHGQGPVL